MKHHINNMIAVVAVALIVMGSFLIFQTTNSNKLTGFSVYDPDSPICHKNINSCIDLNGDGAVNISDESIFSCLIDENGSGCPKHANDTAWNETFGNTYEHFRLLADFDNSGNITQLIDFQRCYVPMRDRAIDDGMSTNITCNLPRSAVNDEVCQGGCPDLNGDGFVDKNDLDIITSAGVWMNTTFNTTYPMADMNLDGKVDWVDRNCMTLYSNEYALCNMPRYFNHYNENICPDLANITTDLDNDGFVNGTDKKLFDAYFNSTNQNERELVNFNGGAVNWEDKWIFDAYLNYKGNSSKFNSTLAKVVACNLYHAAWHTGGVDQVLNSTPLGQFTSTTINFTTFAPPSQFNYTQQPKYGWLTKIRIKINGTSANTEGINLTLIDPSTNRTLATSTISPFEGDRWATAYFSNPPYTNPRLTNGTKYQVNLTTSGNYEITAETVTTTHYAIQWVSYFPFFTIVSYTVTTPLANFETYMTTASADLNGDGIVDEKDKDIILKIPDGTNYLGSGFNPLLDVNDDSVIDQLDYDIVQQQLNTYGNPIVAVSQNISITLTQDANRTFGNNIWLAQGFNAQSDTLQQIALYLAKKTPSGANILVSLQGENANLMPDGNNITTATIPATQVQSGFTWINVTMNVKNLTVDKKYYIVAGAPDSNINDTYMWAESNQ